MKTTLTFLKSLVLLLALSYTTRAAAQCQANFTYTVNGGTIQFTNTSTYNGYALYSWNFGDNTPLDYSMNPTHMYASAGTYNVCLTLNDSLAPCQNTYCANVTATVGCGGFSMSITSSNPSNCSVCDGSISTSVSGGTSPYSYVWSNSSTTASLSNLCAGSYDVTVSDANNCTLSGNAYLNCVPFDSCHPTFTHSAPSGNSVYFYNTSGSDSMTAVFAWDFGDNTYFNGPNPGAHTYASPGTYLVTLTVTDSTFNCSGTFSDSVVAGGPTSCYTYFSMAQDSFNPLQWYAYTSLSGQAPFTYLWDFGDNTTSTSANPQHNYAVAGQYTICLSTTDANGCTSSYCDSSSVHRTASAQQMQYFTADPSPAGIHEQTNTDIHTWPNPSSDIINVSMNTSIDGVVTITDLLGNVVLEQKVNGKTFQVDVNSLPAGYYNMSVTNGTSKWNEKIVIIR